MSNKGLPTRTSTTAKQTLPIFKKAKKKVVDVNKHFFHQVCGTSDMSSSHNMPYYRLVSIEHTPRRRERHFFKFQGIRQRLASKACTFIANENHHCRCYE